MTSIYKRAAKPTQPPARELLGIDPGVKITPDVLETVVLGAGLSKKMNMLIGSLIVEESLWDEAMLLSGSEDDRTAFRISWGLEWAYTLEPKELELRAKRFVRDFLDARNESVNRVYSKMLCDMTRRGAVELDPEEAISVAEKAFDLLINPKTAVAVKVWQIELLYDLRSRMDWIEEALVETVRTLSEATECTPGMASHARHFFRRIKKSKKTGGKI